MDDLDINKIRRFSLFLSLLLIIYVTTGIHLKENELNILSNKFSFDKHWLIPLIFFFFSLYGILRFIYYGVVANIHPIQARKILLDDKGPVEGWDEIKSEGGAQKAEFDIKRRQLFNQQVAKYFPGITVRKGDKWQEQITFFTKLKYCLHDIDYYAPIWVGLISIFIFLIYNFCK